MWDYIEHSLDPRSEVEKAHELLRRGGILALSTGDVDSLVGRLSGSRWHLLTPRHHNFFFGSSTLGSDCSAKRVRGRLDASSVLLVLGRPYLAYKFDRIPRARPGPSPRDRDFSGRPHRRPCNLFDIVTVVARAAG